MTLRCVIPACSPIFLLGDFNYPSIVWSEPIVATTLSSECKDFVSLCLDFNLTQQVTKPTRVTPLVANVLDLVLTTHPDIVSPIIHLAGLSDHSILHFDVKAAVPKPSTLTKQIRNYAKADFIKINHDLEAFFDVFLAGFSSRSVEENWQLYKTKVHMLINQHIPLRTAFENSQSPWFTRALKRLSNKKKRLFRAERRWSSYKALLQVAQQLGVFLQ